MARKDDVHISKSSAGTGWKVTQGGSVLSTHRTQRNAVDVAKKEAQRDRVDLVVHDRDGRIRSKDSFARDPQPPRPKAH